MIYPKKKLEKELKKHQSDKSRPASFVVVVVVIVVALIVVEPVVRVDRVKRCWTDELPKLERHLDPGVWVYVSRCYCSEFGIS